MMTAIKDDAAWFEAVLDTPLWPVPYKPIHKKPSRPEDVADLPGVSLKSREVDPVTGWPKLFARLVSYSDKEVVVVSKCDATTGGLKCVWRGTPGQYLAMWEVD